MTTVNVYLNFDGNCEEAFLFYKSVFGGEFPYIGRFGDMPPQEGMPPIDRNPIGTKCEGETRPRPIVVVRSPCRRGACGQICGPERRLDGQLDLCSN